MPCALKEKVLTWTWAHMRHTTHETHETSDALYKGLSLTVRSMATGNNDIILVAWGAEFDCKQRDLDLLAREWGVGSCSS